MKVSTLRWLPPALLLLVALNQHRLALVDQLTPWCGGGFGMFSTNDGRDARHLHAYAFSPGVQSEIAIPPELIELANSAAALPSETRLRDFARAIAPFAGSEFEEPESIRIDVFATRFTESTLATSGVLLRSVEWPVARP